MKKFIPKVKLPDVKLPGMKMPSFFPKFDMGDQLFKYVGSAFDTVTGTFDTGVGVLKSTMGGIPFFGATATSKVYDHTQIDEKHYFLIPDPASVEGFSLYVLRCLPAGVPPINDLPKRRLLHLPHEAALPMLQGVVVKEARQTAEDGATADNFVSNNLTGLMNEIDAVDGKIFNGVLLIGGLVALVNPLAGAAVAMKAIVPSVGLILSKYGLKVASETATNVDIANQIRRAEKDVKKQFKAANTISLINPVLHHLEAQTKLDMWMMDAEKFQFQSESMAFAAADIRRLTDLTRQAITDVRGTDVPRDYLDQITEIIRSG